MTFTRRVVDLSDEQTRAVEAITDFLDDPARGSVFVLHGLAGSGKTTVLAHLARHRPASLLTTFTGKAASVLQSKTGCEVLTIHQAIYRLESEAVLPNRKLELTWSAAHADGAYEGQVILLDECSMVSSDIAQDMLRTGARIVAVGDPGQLPPVKGNPFFTRPDFMLNEIHRQAWNSPIIRQAHSVRLQGTYTADGEDFQVVHHADRDSILDADVIICWKNATRLLLNNLRRAHLGVAHMPPREGETLVCLMNNRQLGLFNGATYTLGEHYVPKSNKLVLDIDGQPVTVSNTFIEGLDDDGRIWSRDVTPFGYGYALTAHKCQGSEFARVLLYDEYARPDGYREWAYTGITRASKHLTIIKPWS